MSLIARPPVPSEPLVTCDQVVAALGDLRLAPTAQEYDLHQAIAQALSRSGLPFIHEARIAPRCRIDFLCGGVGIEVKRGRPAPGTLLAQLNRYCACEQVHALVLVVERTARVPRSCHGKHVRLLSLNRLWGVSLP